MQMGLWTNDRSPYGNRLFLNTGKWIFHFPVLVGLEWDQLPV
jgi:hypothetical protein